MQPNTLKTEDGTILDPKVLKVVRAIRQVESGGDYNAVGDGGQSHGAYQWNKDNFRNAAREILGDENAPMTPANQNKVAYHQMKAYKDAGRDPEEIAALWNGAHKDETTGKYTYNNPEYGKKFRAAVMGGNFSPSSTPTQEPPFRFSQPETPVDRQNKIEQYKTEAAQSQKESEKANSLTGFLGNFGKALVSNLAGSEVGLGESLAKIVHPFDEGQMEAQQQGTGIQANLLKQIRADKAMGKDTTRLEQEYNRLAGTNAQTTSNIQGQVANIPSTGKVVGQLGGTALDLLTAGTYGKAAAGMESGKLAVQGATSGLLAKSGIPSTALTEGKNIVKGIATGVGLPELGKVAEQNASGLLTRKGLANVAKGAGIGYGYDVTQGLQGSRGEDRTGGASLIPGIGTLVGGGIPAISEVGQSLTNRFTQSGREARFNEAVDNIADQYKKSLPLTPTEKAKEAELLTRTGDNVYTTYAKNGINIGSDEAPARLQEISDQYRSATQHAQANERAYFNVEEIRQNAFKEIDNNLSSEIEREKAKNQVTSEIETLLNKNKNKVILGENGERKISADLQERLRKTGNDWGQYNKFNPNTVKNASGRSLANAVRDQVEKEGTFPAYREANKEWGKIIHAQEILGKIERTGKQFKTPGGLSGAIARRVLSGVLGYHTAGIGGAILTELGSEYGAQILSNPRLRTYFDRRIVEEFAGKNPTPQAIAKLEAEIRAYVDKQAELLKLPAGASISMGSPQPPSAIDPEAIAKNNQYYAEQAQRNTLKLPAGNPNAVNGETIRLRAPASVEKGFINRQR